MKKMEDKITTLKPEYKKDKVTQNYDITIALLGIGIIIMLGIMIFIR